MSSHRSRGTESSGTGRKPDSACSCHCSGEKGKNEFYDFKPSGKVISIGYRFLSKYWGKGIATSCIHALLEFIHDNTKVELVTAHVLPENKASACCLLKNGFEYLLTKEEDWGYDRPCLTDVYTFDC